ncbi:unnamed protein product [Bemisia tabaci]|uniref:Uncharacterized protein n=1 Tax=Bemisia tabaci TaxID=7038 RepID=A0A9P0FAV2_BEMTA|nr:unnamed protein product [Bemisia tabaci]
MSQTPEPPPEKVPLRATMEDIDLGSDTETDKKDDSEVKLEAKMSLLNGITVIVGSIIGSGIFVSPSGVLRTTGSVNMALIVWTISGVFSMVGAYCYAELGCMISKSGADYAYIMETFGPFLAFIRLWIECMIVRPCSQAIVALTFSIYVLKPFFVDCDPPDLSVRLLAVCCIRQTMKNQYLKIGENENTPTRKKKIVQETPKTAQRAKKSQKENCKKICNGIFSSENTLKIPETGFLEFRRRSSSRGAAHATEIRDSNDLLTRLSPVRRCSGGSGLKMQMHRD